MRLDNSREPMCVRAMMDDDVWRNCLCQNCTERDSVDKCGVLNRFFMVVRVSSTGRASPADRRARRLGSTTSRSWRARHRDSGSTRRCTRSSSCCRYNRRRSDHRRWCSRGCSAAAERSGCTTGGRRDGATLLVVRIGVLAPGHCGDVRSRVLRVEPAVRCAYSNARGEAGRRQRERSTGRGVRWDERHLACWHAGKVRRWEHAEPGRRRSDDRACTRSACLPWLEGAVELWRVDSQGGAGSQSLARVRRDPSTFKTELVRPQRGLNSTRSGAVPDLKANDIS